MNNIDKKQNFTSKIYSHDVEKVNPFFSKVKIYVLYEGFNRNGSYLSKDAIDKAIQSIFNIPIVGEFLVEEKNFGTHGANVVKDEQGKYQLVLSTKPYGVIPESAKVYWETVNEEDGTQRDYLVVDGAFLWTGRYPELNTIFDEGYYNQSMEIQMVNSKYSLIEGQETLNIQEFIFTAFCLLGIDKDSDKFGHVQPAFESGKVVAYSLDKETFTNQFNQMIDELKFTLKEGGNSKMDDTKQFVDEAQNEIKKRLEGDATDEETVIPETQEVPETVETEQATQTVTETTEDPTEDESGVTEPTTPETETAPTGEAESATDGGDTGATFTVTEDEFGTLKANFEAVETENAELREYKRGRELGDLKDKFSNQVSDQEISALFENRKDTSIQDLEVELFALIGKKNFSFDEGKTKQNKVTVVSPKVENNDNPYGDIKFLTN